jgi:heptosyltransferase-2
VIRTTALPPALRRLYPQMELVWITSRDALPIVGCQPDVSLAALIDDPPEAPWRLRHYDWVISLDDDEPVCALAANLRTSRLSGGYKINGCRTYTRDLEQWFGMGLLRSEREGGLARANALKRENQSTYGEILFRCLGLLGPVPRPYVRISEVARARAIEWMNRALPRHPIVALNTGAGGRWRCKSWGESQTAKLAQLLCDEFGVSVAVVGGQSETARNQRIVASAARPSVVAAPTDLDLISFAALLEQCDSVVSSDSLALHLATALRKPVVVFFGPTSAAEIDLYGLGEKVLTPLACRACYLKNCQVKSNCMESISVQRMLEAVARWLNPIPRAGDGLGTTSFERVRETVPPGYGLYGT